ncbi:MAG: DUF1585 domain-containing protein, partial [Rubripirellula sp.]
TESGDRFDDIRSFKELLLENEETITRSVTKQMLTYSLGRRLSFSDREDIESITEQTLANGNGLRTLIQNIVLSDLFRKP